MVAGRRLWGDDEERAAEHQPRSGGELGVEAVLEHRGRAGEHRRLFADVESLRPVDEKDDEGAEQAEDEDDAPEARPAAEAGEQAESAGGDRDRHQQVGVGVDRGLERHGRRLRDFGQALVAGLADLDPAVVDELRDQQTGGGGDDGGADRPFGREDRARPSGGADRRSGRPPPGPLADAERPQEEDAERPQPPAAPAQRPHSACVQRPSPAQQAPTPANARQARLAAVAQDRPLGSDQNAVHATVDRPRPPEGPLPQRRPAPPSRCYHRASLSPRFLGGLSRAREGLFLAPIPALAGWLPFRSSPLLHTNTFTLRTCHEASH